MRGLEEAGGELEGLDEGCSGRDGLKEAGGEREVLEDAGTIETLLPFLPQPRNNPNIL